MTKDTDGRAEAAVPAKGAMSEAEIDDNLAETFPASDPPSWTLGTNHREVSKQEEAETESANESGADAGDIET